MAIKTYNQQPYVDDFGVEDINFPNRGTRINKTAEEKNFLRILFKPGISVQVRELNQMQSILQNQIDKLGKGVFKEGPVPGLATETTVDRSVKYVDILINTTGVPELKNNLSQLNSIRYESSTGVYLNAEVLHIQALTAENTYRLYIKYLDSVVVAGENLQEFSDDRGGTADIIKLGNSILNTNNETLYGANIDIGTVVTDGVGSAIHIKSEEGVFFVKGQFVYSEDQDIYAKLPSEDYLVNAKVVFKVVETVLNYQDDESLLDNAAGYPNQTAPGADRYTIDLQLAVLSQNLPSPSLDGQFIEDSTNIFPDDGTIAIGNILQLLELDDNAIVQVARPELSSVGDILAERTREESGDYALEPYIIDIQGFYNDTTKDSLCGRGVYTTTQMNDSDIVITDEDISEVVSSGNPSVTLSSVSDPNKIKFGKTRFSIGIEPSIAYVDGYRIAEPERVEVIAERARKTSGYQQSYSNATQGSYIKGESFTGGAPSFDVDSVYNITDGTNTLATCKVRSLEKQTTSSSTTGELFKLYVYDIQFELDASNNPYTSLTGATDITLVGGSFNFNIDPAQIGLFDTQYNRPIYPLPANFIKQIKQEVNDQPEFTQRKLFTGTVVSTTELTIDAPAGGRFEEFGTDSFIVIDTTGNERNVTNVSRENNNATARLTTESMNIGGSANTLVVASVRTKLTEKGKDKQTVTDEILVADGTTVNTNSTYPLANHDIIAITSAEDYAGNDVTADLVLDNGQRDGCYKLGSIKYTGAQITASGNGTGGLKISYTYFSHSSTGDYFSVNSYKANLSTSNVDYSEIPNYKELRLSDCLDFRAKEGDGDTGTHLDPNSTIDSKIDYYLSRIDKLVVTKDGQFKLINGVPAIDPIAPEVPSTAMHLYTLFIPAFTFCHTNITTDYVDNRRYTMRDIGGIETRVQNLEYYTSLSLLEQEAEGKQIFDTDANAPYDRFKNGIIVDSFAGHLIGYVDDEHYNCSMDPDDHLLRPYFETRSVPFTKSTTVNHIDVKEGLATLAYSEGPAFISQMQAGVAISVNPYDVATWLGSVKLSPSSDEWLETRRAPDIVNNVGGNLNEMQAEVNRVNKLGTQWNSWQTTWTGKPKTTRTSEFRAKGWGKISPGRRGFAPDGSGRYKDTTWRETQSRQTREGVKTTASIRTVSQVKDDKVISVSFVPFIRARKVYFKGQLFKPNTKLKVFFDGVDITKYSTGVAAADFKEWSSNASVRTYHNQQAANITGTAAQVTAANSAATSADIVSDDSGEVYGWFVVPNNSEHQFKTGERKFMLTDGVSTSDPKATTNAEAVYTATGKMQTKQRTVVNTRTIVRRTQKVSQSRLQTSKVAIRTVYHDPLAQSFVIGENPNGLYIHSLDLYFSTVPTKNIPLKMYLVEVENGYPTQRVVPLSEVVKQKSEINETKSTNASTPTTFTFDAPIFLQFGSEYAIVTESNSAQYRQWLSEVGTEDRTTGEFISKNPYLGVSFKSQNASTWTADQMKDFKMELRRAEYKSQGSIVLDSVGIGSDTEAAGSDEIEGPLEYSQLMLNTDFINHPETDVLFEISTEGGGVGTYYTIIPNENYYLSTPQGTKITSNSKIKIRVTLKTNDTKITPVVDLDRISLIAVKNIIGPEGSATDTSLDTDDSLFQSGTDSELAATHGNATAVYMTKEVVLNNPSDRLDSYLNIHRPYNDSNVLVYARFKRSEDNIEDLTFERIDPETPIPVKDIDDYAEIKYTEDFSATAQPLFNSFQVKIVLTSNDHSLVPMVKDFRAIATI
jgi:hypothetical protein